MSLNDTAFALPPGTLLSRFQRDRNIQFWVYQFLGWGGFCVVTFLTLTAWYATFNWSHISHTIFQAILGVGLTTLMRLIYRRLWTRSLAVQFTAVLLTVIVLSGVWTVARMQAFLWLVTNYNIWQELGGWYFSSFFVFISWSAFYLGIKFYQLLQDERKQRIEEQIMRLSAEAGSREAQMKMLRYQLNPHFLFNTLNSISALVKTQRNDQARNMITQLSHFLRFTLDNENLINVRLEEELRCAQLYLDIEKVRYGDRLATRFDVDKKTLDAQIPCMILQPLFENALQHAVAEQVRGGQVNFKATRANERVVITLDDSGHPDASIRPGVAPHLDKGIGLSNIEGRLAAHYNNEASVSYSGSDLGGLRVVLSIPYRAMQTTLS